jgi:hypothetical protein
MHHTALLQGYTYDHEMGGDDWEVVVAEFKKLSGKMPQQPAEQLEMAIMAVFSSWFTPRAVRYRCVSFKLWCECRFGLPPWYEMGKNAPHTHAYTYIYIYIHTCTCTHTHREYNNIPNDLGTAVNVQVRACMHCTQSMQPLGHAP